MYNSWDLLNFKQSITDRKYYSHRPFWFLFYFIESSGKLFYTTQSKTFCDKGAILALPVALTSNTEKVRVVINLLLENLILQLKKNWSFGDVLKTILFKILNIHETVKNLRVLIRIKYITFLKFLLKLLHFHGSVLLWELMIQKLRLEKSFYIQCLQGR